MRHPTIFVVLGLCGIQVFRNAFYVQEFLTSSRSYASVEFFSLLQARIPQSIRDTAESSLAGLGLSVEPKNATRGSMHATVLSHPVSLQPPPVVDILSIGSKERLFFLNAQRRTMGLHYTVRSFVTVTEEDDIEQDCHGLRRSDAREIIEFCRLPKEHEAKGPLSIINTRRKDYTEWKKFVIRKPKPVGWICAQKRASDGLHRLLQQYTQNTTFANVNSDPEALDRLPDYVFIMDDDTFMDMTAVTDYLRALYDPNEPFIIAGCLLRYSTPTNSDTFTIPWGGFSTILSKGALQNLFRPIHCPGSHDPFSENACQRLQQNLFGEKRYFVDGMSVADLMFSYTSTTRYSDHKNWTLDEEKDDSIPSYCAYSDWVWGFFFNYYNIGVHSGNPSYREVPEDRIRSYRLSELFVRNMKDPRTRRFKGQCAHSDAGCTSDSHICHMVNTLQMRDYTKIFQERNPHHYDKKPLVQTSEWKAIWSKQKEETVGTERQEQGLVSATNVTSSGKPTRVFLFPGPNFVSKEELEHFVLDGIKESSKLALVDNAYEASVWVVDARRTKLQDCERLFRETRAVRGQMPDDWRVLLLHWSKDPAEDFTDCLEAVRLIDTTRIHRFKRSVVTKRQWNETKQFVEQGTVLTYGNWRDHSGRPVERIHYGVRTDVVKGFERILTQTRQVGQETFSDLATTGTMMVDLPRPTDVSHFWSLSDTGSDLTGGSNTHLRSAVGRALDIQVKKENDRLVFLGIAGSADAFGRNTAQKEYLGQLLASKIVVIAQRDDYEDDYRLMEALVSGAMVVMDPMVTMPDGLEDGVSVVVYRSLTDLVSKVLHYLDSPKERHAIALKGYEVAMQRHRSWHMMERIIL